MNFSRGNQITLPQFNFRQRTARNIRSNLLCCSAENAEATRSSEAEPVPTSYQIIHSDSAITFPGRLALMNSEHKRLREKGSSSGAIKLPQRLFKSVECLVYLAAEYQRQQQRHRQLGVAEKYDVQ